MAYRHNCKICRCTGLLDDNGVCSKENCQKGIRSNLVFDLIRLVFCLSLIVIVNLEIWTGSQGLYSSVILSSFYTIVFLMIS
jgi:hypothetical protein